MGNESQDSAEAIDRLWGAIAGLRRDFEVYSGRLEAFLESRRAEAETGKAEETAEIWRQKRQEEIDRLMDARRRTGKDEELDSEDEERLSTEWMNS